MGNIIYRIYTFFKKNKIFKIWRFVLSKFLNKKNLIYIYKFYMYKAYVLSIVKIENKISQISLSLISKHF